MNTVDIRPMSLGEVLDRTFSVYKSNFLLLAGIVAVPLLFKFVYMVGLEWFQRMTIRGGTGPSIGMIFTWFGGIMVVALITLVLTSAAEAGTIIAVSEIYLGRTTTVSDAYRPVRARFLRLLGLILLRGLMCGAGLFLLAVPGIYLYCKTALVIPAMMLEDEDVGGSITRSFDLTRDFFWQIFLIFLFVVIIQWVAGSLLAAPVLVAVAVMKMKVVPLGLAVLQHLGEFVAEIIITPLGTIAIALMYYNLRVRKEAFDLQHLMTSLEAKAGSDAPSLA